MLSSDKKICRVLVVDDDPYAIEPYLEALANDFTFKYAYARGFEEALLFLKSDLFDVAVIDKMMPPGNLDQLRTGGGATTGIELCRLIRRDYSNTKIVMLSLSRPEPHLKRDNLVDEYL